MTFVSSLAPRVFMKMSSLQPRSHRQPRNALEDTDQINPIPPVTPLHRPPPIRTPILPVSSLSFSNPTSLSPYTPSSYRSAPLSPSPTSSPQAIASSIPLGNIRHRHFASSTPAAHQQQPNEPTFVSSTASTTPSLKPSSSLKQQPPAVHARPYFRSRRVRPGTVAKPWLDDRNKDWRERWINWIPVMGVVVGLLGSALLIWSGVKQVENYEYCLILAEDWSSGTIDPERWLVEGKVNGFKYGEFQQYTHDAENIYVSNGALYIKPTQQNASLIETNSTLNYTLNSPDCTSSRPADCLAATNLANLSTIPPARSAQLSTRNRTAIRYGRAEVTARLPAGKWLWPRIQLLPLNATYGAFPASGAVDVAVARGNDPGYLLAGNDIVSSGLHFGPDVSADAYDLTLRSRRALLSTYAWKAHTFGVEWSPTHVLTYVDSRLYQTAFVSFSADQPLWKLAGTLLPFSYNATRLMDRWRTTGADNVSAPFDQPFYLSIGLAVGGTNGWFADGVDGKPWVDGEDGAARDFWDGRDDWLGSWEDSEMIISAVKLWQQKGYNGC